MAVIVLPCAVHALTLSVEIIDISIQYVVPTVSETTPASEYPGSLELVVLIGTILPNVVPAKAAPLTGAVPVP